MTDSVKSKEEVAYLLTTLILNTDTNQRKAKTDILSLYGECLTAIKDTGANAEPRIRAV